MSDETKGDFEKFKDYILENVTYLTDRFDNDVEYGEELRKSIKAQLLDEKYTYSVKPPARRDDIFLLKLGVDFLEIHNSLEYLKDFEIYISIFPYKKKGVAPLRYITHTIGNYLNEIYMLRERLRAFLNFLERRYKKNSIHKTLKSEIDRLQTLISESLEVIISLRGNHVHEKRYGDKDLEKLGLLSVLVEEKNIHPFPRMYEIEFKTIKKKWKKTIIENNTEIEMLLDFCFGRLGKIILDDKNKIILPDEATTGHYQLISVTEEKR